MSDEPQIEVLERGQGPNVSSDIDLNEQLAAATEALKGIQATERLSGLGRFASKVQKFFQASLPSKFKSAPRLRAAPTMMLAGVVLLIVTGFLFVLSKPESAVQGHFHQNGALSGAEDQKHTSAGSEGTPVLTENQLIGSDGSADSQGDKPRSQQPNSNGTTHRLGISNDEGGVSNSPKFQTAPNELQAPATVFIAGTALNPFPMVLNPSQQQVQGSETQLPAGTEIVAHTTNAISSGLESPVVALVDRDVEIGDVVIIPQGSRVIGSTAGAVKDRINVRFTSLLLPDRREITISALALMRDGSAGLVGKVQGSAHPILAGAGRVATGAAVAATEFAGQDSASLNQPFSQSAYLRNELAGEVAAEGTRESNRLQQPMSIPIVKVNTNQSIRIFLLSPLAPGRPNSIDAPSRNVQPTPSTVLASSPTDENARPEQALVGAQTAYIQALEDQLAEMRAEIDARKQNG